MNYANLDTRSCWT